MMLFVTMFVLIIGQVHLVTVTCSSGVLSTNVTIHASGKNS